MGAGAIPFTAIIDYSKIYAIEDFDEFLYFIRLLDSRLLELEAKKNTRKENGPTKSGKKN